MFAPVQTSLRTLEEQIPSSGAQSVEDLLTLAAPLRGARVLNLSVSPFGTSVADMLHNLVPLLQDVGIEAEWQIVGSDDEFAAPARALYAGLSGRVVEWNDSLAGRWREHGERLAALFEGEYDAVIVHDAQPVALATALAESGRAKRSRWAWHCHLDLHLAQPEVWNAFAPLLSPYARLVFPDSSFLPPGLPDKPVAVIPPAIDPASARNADVAPSIPRQLLSRYGLDPLRPLLVQVAPLDPGFDPVGAIDVYRRVRQEHPGLQLMLVHPIAESSLDAWSRFEKVARYLGGERDAKVLASQGDGGQTVVNAAQRAATVIIQRSVPAGFACQVWEGQWKAKPVVVGAAGGLSRQVLDGRTGYVVSGESQFVEAVAKLVGDSELAGSLGEAGKLHVRRNHLLTRLVADELRLLEALLA